MTAATLDGRVFEPSAVRPAWLRPLVIAIVIALHAAALSIVYLEPTKPPEPPEEVTVDIEQEAPPAEAPPAPPAELPKPPEQSAPPPAEAAAPAPAEPPPPIPAPPPAVEQPPPRPVEAQPALPPPEPAPPVAEQPPLPPLKPPPPAPVELAPAKPEPPPRIEPRPKRAAEPARERPETAEHRRQLESERRTASLETGRPEAPASRSVPASAALRSAYSGEVSGIIRSRLFYPEAARARGARGVVGVSFSIGASGAVTAFSITRSSGDHDLDAAARSLVEGSRFPPPPGGSAHIATSFNYAPR